MFKKILGTVAPFLGSMIGGPFGTAVQKLVGTFLCDDENASEEDMEKALSQASPEQLSELKRIDAEYKTRMAELGVDEQKIAALDRDSARQREVKLQDKIPAILSLLLTCGFFGILGTIMFYPIEETSRGVIDIMLGSLGTAWISCITYYFGSSHGSKIKTQLMSR